MMRRVLAYRVIVQKDGGTLLFFGVRCAHERYPFISIPLRKSVLLRDKESMHRLFPLVDVFVDVDEMEGVTQIINHPDFHHSQER